MPPVAVAIQNTLRARARSEAGVHLDTADVQFGKAPASPAPNRKSGRPVAPGNCSPLR